ncbi:dynamin family protein [Dactylosporangium cerinum]|uniref:Dynamin family protein n=1 Tax=Dactylosporangium cerinum TaxID=1434730 RepID=A0ABV9WEX9_9ACTN
MEHPLSDRLAAACAEAAARVRSDAAVAAVARARARLADRTLRVAVGGRVNAGKSTIVNAMLGHRLAPTGSTECTKIAAWFEYHHQDQLVVHWRDGRPPETVPAKPGGGIPDDLPHSHTEVSHFVARATDRRIGREFVIVDTPGSDSLSGLDDYSMGTIRQADALVYVTEDAGEVNRAALEGFRADVSGAHLSRQNVIAVLSWVDKIADHEPPERRRVVAARMARRAARDLRALVCEVVPVAGLLAQTARGADFTELHAAALRRLAAADPVTRADLLLADEMFLDGAPELGVDRSMRADLLRLLDRYGVEEAFNAIDRGAVAASAILAGLEEVSGINDLLSAIHRRFQAAADPVRAGAAAAALERELAAARRQIATDPAERAAVADLLTVVRTIRRDPATRITALLAAVSAYETGALPLDGRAADELTQIAHGETPAQRLGLPGDASPGQVRAEAGARIDRWRAVEYQLPPHSSPHATVVLEVLEQLFLDAGPAHQAGAGTSGAARSSNG